MPEFNNILLVAKGTDWANARLAKALMLAAVYRSQMTVLDVIDEVPADLRDGAVRERARELERALASVRVKVSDRP